MMPKGIIARWITMAKPTPAVQPVELDCADAGLALQMTHWLAHLRSERRLAASSVMRKLASLRGLHRFLVREGQGVRGFIDQCPHAGWPLGFDDRYLTKAGDHILCAGHGALFDLDGVGVTTPCVGERLTPWPVALRDGEVFTA